MSLFTNNLAASRLLSPDATHQLNIFWGDSDPFAVEANKVCVLKQAHQIHLGSFMQRSQSIGLEAQSCFDIVCDFPDESGKRQLWDQVVRPLLVVPDLIECDGPRTKPCRGLACLSGDSSSPGLLRGVPRLFASGVWCLNNEISMVLEWSCTKSQRSKRVPICSIHRHCNVPVASRKG